MANSGIAAKGCEKGSQRFSDVGRRCEAWAFEVSSAWI